MTKEEIRHAWMFRIPEQFLQDFRFAIRSLRRSVAFTAIALLTIVLTVGGISVVFTIVNSVVLNPLPYPEADRLVWITQSSPGSGRASLTTAVVYGDFADIRSQSRSFDAMAGFGGATGYWLDPEAAPYRVRAREVTPELLPLLGADMFLGSVPASADPTLEEGVVSYDFWRARLGARPDVIGSTVRLGTRQRAITVVGVTEPSPFDLPAGNYDPEVPKIWILLDPSERMRRDTFGGWNVVARLGEGVSIDAARSELTAISEGLAAEYPDTNTGRSTHATFLLDQVVGDAKRQVWIFFGAVFLVVLTGVANLTNLQIVRNTAREAELHIRAALGAGRPRLVGQLVVEAVALSLAGGLLGLAVASAGVRLVVAALPPGFPRSDEIGVDPAVFLFALVVSLLTAAAFGLIPAWQASRPGLLSAIKEGSAAVTLSLGRGRLQRSLIGVETALSLVLLVGAALLTHSFWLLFEKEAGMDEENLWSIEVRLGNIYYLHAPEGFWASLLEDLEELPQVELAAAAVNSPTPLSGGDIGRFNIYPEDQNEPPIADALVFSHRRVTPGFFDTIGIPVIRGRNFIDGDRSGSEWVAILNEVAARALWPDKDAVGQSLRGFGASPVRVVGIIRDLNNRRLDESVQRQLYTVFGQESGPSTQAALMIRGRPGTTGLREAVETVIRSYEPEAALTPFRSMAQVRWQLLTPERFRTGILLTFGLTATFLAMVGIFGVVAYSVVQRRREIGLRMALGAMPSDIRRLIMSQALVPVAVGLIAGLMASLGLTRLLSSYLFDISPADPATLATALLLFLSAALLASLLPVRRATRIDPMVALRYE